jgi:hypothetical protein
MGHPPTTENFRRVVFPLLAGMNDLSGARFYLQREMGLLALVRAKYVEADSLA